MMRGPGPVLGQQAQRWQPVTEVGFEHENWHGERAPEGPQGGVPVPVPSCVDWHDSSRQAMGS
jgi:hypothetical protein